MLMRRSWFTIGVICIRGEAKTNHALVVLLGMCIELRQARQVTQNDRQNSSSRWIEGSEMTDRTLAENSADPIHYVMRRQTSRFIDDYDAVHRCLQSGNL
jgi:hypothetical protein